MTNLSASLLQLRSAYGRAHQYLLGDNLNADAGVLELAEALVEELPPEALALSAVQATMMHLVNKLPETPDLKTWSRRLAVHLYHSGVSVREPLYSRLYDLPVEAVT